MTASAGRPSLPAPARRGRGPHLERFARLSLYWRTLLVNGAVVAFAGFLLAITPVTVSSPIRTRQGLTYLGDGRVRA